MKSFKSVEAYIRDYPKAVQAVLKKLRATILKAAPGAVESVSYGMPGYKSSGRPVAYFGGFENHVSFFAAGAVPTADFKAAKKYQSGKSAMRFPHGAIVPYALIARIVEFRVKQRAKKAK